MEYRTRSGLKVRLLDLGSDPYHTDENGVIEHIGFVECADVAAPVIARFVKVRATSPNYHEVPAAYTIVDCPGKHPQLWVRQWDLVEHNPWLTAKVNDPVLMGKEQRRMHFAAYSDGYVFCFPDGGTSFSTGLVGLDKRMPSVPEDRCKYLGDEGWSLQPPVKSPIWPEEDDEEEDEDC